jgi:mRNA interferase RelE/StbE
MSCQVEIETRARREYRDLPADIRRRITDAIDDLQADPRPPGGKRLVGKAGYRLRAGDYRILYVVDDDSRTVRIYWIGHRREVYRARSDQRR